MELALWLESDRMGYLLEKIDQAALSNQQDVVRNERRQSVENEPYGLAEEALTQSVFPAGHPYYGNVIGSHEDIQAAKLDDVKRFFRQYYAPNNASLAIVGDFEPAQMKALVQKYFGTLKRGPAVPPIKAETPKITSERRKVVTARVELPRVYMAWLTSPILKPGDADADIAATILGGGRSSRLYKKLVYEKQIAQDVTAQQYSLMLGSVFQIQATARPGHTVEELEKAIEEELAVFRSKPADTVEIERARNMIETNIIGGLERLGGFGGIADRLNSYNHYLGNPDYLQQDIQRYRGVTASTLQTFARDQLAPTARVVMHVVPGQPAAAAAGRDAAGVEGGRRRGRRVDQRGRTVAQRDAEAGRGAAAAAGHAGVGDAAEWSDADPERAARACRSSPPIWCSAPAAMRTRSISPASRTSPRRCWTKGTTTRNALQIADEVAQLGASLGISSSMDATTLAVRSLSKNFGGDGGSARGRDAASVVPGAGDRASARQPSGRAGAAARQPESGRRSSDGVSALRAEASVRLQRDRHGGGAQERVARRHGGVLEAELRAEQRGARRRR